MIEYAGMGGRVPGLGNFGGFSTTLKACLGILLLLAVVSAVSNILEFQLLSDIQRGNFTSRNAMLEIARDNDARQRIVNIVRLVFWLGTIVVFSVWIYRAHANLTVLGARDLRFTPGWAVGWYFVPVATWWKPYQAMKEIWRASADPANWQTKRRGGVLPWWWAAFVISNLLGQAVFRLILRAKTVQDYVATDVLSIVSDVVDFIAISLALILVRQIAAMQLGRTAPPNVYSHPQGEAGAPG